MSNILTDSLIRNKLSPFNPVVIGLRHLFLNILPGFEIVYNMLLQISY